MLVCDVCGKRDRYLDVGEVVIRVYHDDDDREEQDGWYEDIGYANHLHLCDDCETTFLGRLANLLRQPGGKKAPHAQ